MTPLGIDIGHVTVLRTTEMALLVSFDDGEEAWIPRSVLDDENELESRGDSGVLIVPRWLAEKLERVTRFTGYPTTPRAERKECERGKKRRAGT